jgi:hypothetical protein
VTPEEMHLHRVLDLLWKLRGPDDCPFGGEQDCLHAKDCEFAEVVSAIHERIEAQPKEGHPPGMSNAMKDATTLGTHPQCVHGYKCYPSSDATLACGLPTGHAGPHETCYTPPTRWETGQSVDRPTAFLKRTCRACGELIPE